MSSPKAARASKKLQNYVEKCDDSDDEGSLSSSSRSSEEEAKIEVNPNTAGSFNWRIYLRRTGSCLAAPVSCFKHVALSNCWEKIIPGVMLEVQSPDCKTCCVSSPPCSYWIASVIKVAGYWGLLRYEGFDTISPRYFNVHDKWVNLCTEPHIHPIGWCADNKKHLVPPKNLEPKKTKSQSAPVKLFTREIPDHGFREGMFLEAVDLMEPRLVCVARIVRVVGRLLRVHFEGWEEEYDQWCDCMSPDLFPVGWCGAVGYRLEAPRPPSNAGHEKKKKMVFKKRGRKRMRVKKSPEELKDEDGLSIDVIKPDDSNAQPIKRKIGRPRTKNFSKGKSSSQKAEDSSNVLCYTITDSSSTSFDDESKSEYVLSNSSEDDD